MGKLSDALEKRKKETTIKAETFPVNRIDSPVKSEPSPSPPPVEKISSHQVDNKLVVITAPDSFEAESFRLLRSQILFGNGKRPRTIMVTSAIPGDGKTFVAANLAASIAMGVDEYVMLIDCDMRRSNLHQMFGLANSDGLHEHLRGKKELPDLLIKTGINKLSLLPAGSRPHNPSELLASNAMKSFLEHVRDRYSDRIIILDTPPSQGLPESNVISNFVDGVLFVIKENQTPRDMAKKSIETFGKEKLIGMVMNCHSQAQKRYEKYYKRYYR